MNKTNRLIFHIDVNSAYLSWSASYRLQHGETIDLREIPSVVGGNESDRHGIVLAKSIPAKKFNIQTGETLYNARLKCPDLVIVPPRYDLYVKCSNAMNELFKEYTPVIQRFSVNEWRYGMMDKEAYIEKKSKVGRHNAFKTEELNYVIKMYIANKKHLTKLSGKHMAIFAREHLVEKNKKYENLQGHHFYRNPIIKQAINDFETKNSAIDVIGRVDTHKMVRFNVDSFFKSSKGDEGIQRKMLESFNSNYEKTYRDLIKADRKIEELEASYRLDMAKKEELIKELKQKNKELSVENRKIKVKIANLNRMDRFIKQLDMYEYLQSKGRVGDLDIENLELLLTRAGLIKAKDSYNDIEGNVFELNEIPLEIDYTDEAEKDEEYAYSDFIDETIMQLDDDIEDRAYAFMDRFSNKDEE